MSLIRLIYYSAIGGGWAAFVGWFLAECLFVRGNGNIGTATVVMVGLIVGAAIGAGLNVVAGMANASVKNLIMRAPIGMIGGGIGGALGILAGQFIYTHSWPRALGFMLLGLGVGIVEGVYERSPTKIRNGAIGGIVGGLVGGFLFDPISAALNSSSGIASRAVAFVILGLCVGAMIGIVQVILKEASLRVLDGYGVGREIILSDKATVIGRGDHLRLPFMGRSNADLEIEHFRIVRLASGAFAIEDNHSKLGVSVRSEGANNYENVQQPRELKDGDVIRFGANLVRFSQRKKKRHEASAVVGAIATGPASTASPAVGQPPPPPPPQRKAKSAAASQGPVLLPSRGDSPSATMPAKAPTLSPVSPAVPVAKVAQSPAATKPPSFGPPPPPPRKKNS